MKIVGIVAEYNPMHLGHIYHIKQAKKHADCLIVIMSGSFVQRGECASYDKWMRCKWALQYGADIVLELPSVYALQSASGFAGGAVRSLYYAGCNAISFGSESSDLQSLMAAVSLINNESSEFKDDLNRELKTGKSYPRSIHSAIERMPNRDEKVVSLLRKPNFILASEYIAAIEKYRLDMSVLPIKRIGEMHDSVLKYGCSGIKKDAGFASASRIRAIIDEDPHDNELANYLPRFVIRDVESNAMADFTYIENTLLYKLRLQDIDFFSKIFGAGEGLDNLLMKSSNATDYEDLLDALKSKRYTLARIRRLLCAVLLEITNQTVDSANEEVPYLRLLGYRKNAQSFVSAMSSGPVPLVAKKRDFDKLAGFSADCIDLDILASDVHALCFPDRERRLGGRDFVERVKVMVK